MTLLSDSVPLHLTMRVRAQLFEALLAVSYSMADLAAAGVRCRVSGTALSGGYSADDRIAYHVVGGIPEALALPIANRYPFSDFKVVEAIDEETTFGLEVVADTVAAVIADELSDEVIHVQADAETLAHLAALAEERGLTIEEIIAEAAVERGQRLAALDAPEKLS